MALSLTSEIERVLYTKLADKKYVDFDHLRQPRPILSLLTIEDIMELNKIAKSKRLSSKPKEKFNMINEIMARRGFKKLAAGTNRLVYKFMEDQSFVLKIPFCQPALTDNLNELMNQNLLRPFVTKVFEVTPCGTVGMFERANPITSREQFKSVAEDIYDIIINHLIGKYIIDDFGSKFFMNWGIRQGQFPVLLDFPYVFELDGSKLYCNKPDPMSNIGYCGGDIDYDDAFNYLVCQKCGKTYLASDLRLRNSKDAPIIITEQKGDIRMKVITELKGQKAQTVDTGKETAVYEKTKSGKIKGQGLAKREAKRNEAMRMEVIIDNVTSTSPAEEPEISGLSDIPKDIKNYPGMDVKVTTKKGNKSTTNSRPGRKSNAIDVKTDAAEVKEEVPVKKTKASAMKVELNNEVEQEEAVTAEEPVAGEDEDAAIITSPDDWNKMAEEANAEIDPADEESDEDAEEEVDDDSDDDEESEDEDDSDEESEDDEEIDVTAAKEIVQIVDDEDNPL